MAMFIWYIVKRTVFSVRVYSSLQWTSYFLQGTRKTRPYSSGHSVPEDRGGVEASAEPVDNLNLLSAVAVLGEGGLGLG